MVKSKEALVYWINNDYAMKFSLATENWNFSR